MGEEKDTISACVDLAQQTKDHLEGLANRSRILSFRLSYTPLKKAAAIGSPSQRGAGLFRVVPRIDGKCLVVLAGQARLLERLHVGEQVFLARRPDEARPDSDNVLSVCGAWIRAEA